MHPSTEVGRWILKNFPKPHIDPEWLEGCTQWLEEDQNISPVSNFEEFMERVKGQLLESDLRDSMQAGTGLDEDILSMSGHLRGPPLLVQIMAITDISSSAYQLDQIRSAREERMRVGEGIEEGEDDGDVEVEGEGPMPKYPRGTLRFQLSDGERTIQAMEYRQISGFQLGHTPLGYKIQLQGTKFQDGMAMLEPDTVILLGGKQSDLQAKQLEDFKWGLHARLGRPFPRSEDTTSSVSARTEETLSVPMAVRSPLVDIPLPASPLLPHNDDIDLEPRRRVPTNSSTTQNSAPSIEKDNKQARLIIGLPSRNNTTNFNSVDEGRGGHPLQERRPLSMAERSTLVQAGSRGVLNGPTTSPFFNQNAVASGSGTTQSQNFAFPTGSEALDFNLGPTHGQITRFLPSPEPILSDSPANPDFFNFDLHDEVSQGNHVAPPSTSLQKGKKYQHGPGGTSPHQTLPSVNDGHSSDDYNMGDDNDFDNPSFLEEFDVLEKAGFQHQPKTNTVLPSSSSSGLGLKASPKPLEEKSSVSPSPPKIPRQNRSDVKPVMDVIEIEDSDDDMEEFEDKENMSIPTRHVRRRMDDSDTAGASWGSSLQTQLSQKGRPIVLATNPDDIIDLSDSD